MPLYAQLVMGPAGSGKSTYCSMMVEHFSVLKRKCHVVNLDPAAEHFSYPVELDIRELICLDDIMEDDELHFGPNGGLIFCMEYFLKNLSWFEETLLKDVEGDCYYLFDCPGQIELYTHLPVMKTLVENLRNWDFNVCGVFLVDSQFLGEPSKFISGMLSSLSCMINLEITHLSVLTKVDLLSKHSKRELQKFLDPEMQSLLTNPDDSFTNKKYKRLTEMLYQLVDDYGLIRFLMLDRSDEESINILLQHIDMALQYGEDQPVRVQDFGDEDG